MKTFINAPKSVERNRKVSSISAMSKPRCHSGHDTRLIITYDDSGRRVAAVGGSNHRLRVSLIAPDSVPNSRVSMHPTFLKRIFKNDLLVLNT